MFFFIFYDFYVFSLIFLFFVTFWCFLEVFDLFCCFWFIFMTMDDSTPKWVVPRWLHGHSTVNSTAKWLFHGDSTVNPRWNELQVPKHTFFHVWRADVLVFFGFVKFVLFFSLFCAFCIEFHMIHNFCTFFCVLHVFVLFYTFWLEKYGTHCESIVIYIMCPIWTIWDSGDTFEDANSRCRQYCRTAAAEGLPNETISCVLSTASMRPMYATPAVRQ